MVCRIFVKFHSLAGSFLGVSGHLNEVLNFVAFISSFYFAPRNFCYSMVAISITYVEFSLVRQVVEREVSGGEGLL